MPLKKAWLAVLLILAPGLKAAPDSTSAQASTITVQICGLTVKQADINFTPKKDYIFTIFDLFPYRDQLAKTPVGLPKLAQGLADGFLLSKFPDTKKAKIVLLEYPDRDDYGAPRWDTVKVLARFSANLEPKGFQLRPEKK
jgi:hypothetical protein